MEYTDFKNMNEMRTIGEIKGNPRKFIKEHKRIGGLSVELLRQYLKGLDNDNSIGVYIDKKGKLAPLHCKGKLIAPKRFNDKHDNFIQDCDEFET